MAPPRTRLTNAEWNQHKPYIRRMIIDQNVSQEEARQRLKDDGVLVTKAQLEYKLKIWGFRKKAPKETSHAIWQFIGYRVEKRKQLQKASDVFLNGQFVGPAKVRKEVNRHQPTSLVRFKQGVMSPKTPKSPEVVIRTPVSTVVQSLWPSCLPWFQFQHQHRLLLSCGLPNSAEASSNAPIRMAARTRRTLLRSLLQSLDSWNAQDSSCLTVDLDLSMLEAYKDENANRAQSLLCGSAAGFTAECMKMVIYQLSNNLFNYIRLDDWDSIFVLLKESGIMKMPLPLKTMEEDTTLQSLAETLFQKAFISLWLEYPEDYIREDFIVESDIDSGLDEEFVVRLPSWEIINWLLSSGQNPNTPILLGDALEHGLEGRFTPLQLAAMGCPHLVLLLLDAGSDPTLVYDDPVLPIKTILLGHISCIDKIVLLKRFLKTKAHISVFEDTRSLLEAALEGLQRNFDISGLELLDLLIDSIEGDWLESQIRTPLRWSTQNCSILGYVAGLSDESAAISCLSHLLERVQQSEPSRLPTHAISDAVFNAALSGHIGVLELLRGFNVDLALCGHGGFTALHIAANHGFLHICQYLLRLGIPVDGHVNSRLPSPLHFAAYWGYSKIIQLLHSHGADLARSADMSAQRIETHFLSHIAQKRAATPVGAVVLNRNYQGLEFFAQNCVLFPPWAAHYESCCHCPQPQAVRLALEMGSDPNWSDDNGPSALQSVLQNPRLVDRADIVEIAMTLLDAGAVLRGGEITKACLLGDWHLIDRLLEMESPDINQRHDLIPAFKEAISNRDRYLLEWLLEKVHLGTVQRHELMSVLDAAVASGSQYLVCRLLDVVHIDTYKQHELMSILDAVIVTGGHPYITQLLRQCPDAYDAGLLCASVYVEKFNLATFELLLNNRPELEDVLPLESLAIGIAAWRERGDCLNLLLAKLPKPSPAALPEGVEHILRHIGPVGDLFNDCGRICGTKIDRVFWRMESKTLGSPLTLALKSEKSVSRLLDHGFLPDRLTMSVAFNLGRNGPIQKLARYPVLSPGFEDCEGPLTAAVREYNFDMVKILSKWNHCVNEKNDLVLRGRSPLQLAVELGNLDLIKLLLDAGANVNTVAARYGGATALQLAAIKGYLQVAKMLVDLGADVNAPGAAAYGGRTALEGAAEHGRIDTIQYLLSQGVETNAKGRLSYLRATRYAELEGHMVAAKLIKKWREWTVKDDTLWNDLKSLSKDECEQFIQEDFEDQSDLESALERYSAGKANEGDGMQDVIFNNAPAAEAHTHEISITANHAGGIISELEDLEMMTNDTFAFWSGQ